MQEPPVSALALRSRSCAASKAPIVTNGAFPHEAPQRRERFFVLRRQPLGEYDDVVVAFGLESGRFSAVVKGSRKPRSRISGLLEPPIELEGVLREGGHLDKLSQLQLRCAYASLRGELTALLTAGFFTRLFAEALPERMASVEGYELFGYLLDLLSAGNDAVATALWGQDRLLATLGVEPELSACLGCGSLAVRGYSPDDGGMLCNDCYGGSGFAVSSGALRRLRQLREEGSAFSSAMTPSEIKEIGRVLKLQFQRHLGLSEKVFRPVLPRSVGSR